MPFSSVCQNVGRGQPDARVAPDCDEGHISLRRRRFEFAEPGAASEFAGRPRLDRRLAENHRRSFVERHNPRGMEQRFRAGIQLGRQLAVELSLAIALCRPSRERSGEGKQDPDHYDDCECGLRRAGRSRRRMASNTFPRAPSGQLFSFSPDDRIIGPDAGGRRGRGIGGGGDEAKLDWKFRAGRFKKLPEAERAVPDRPASVCLHRPGADLHAPRCDVATDAFHGRRFLAGHRRHGRFDASCRRPKSSRNTSARL